jgi:hypothetical protein
MIMCAECEKRGGSLLDNRELSDAIVQTFSLLGKCTPSGPEQGRLREHWRALLFERERRLSNNRFKAETENTVRNTNVNGHIEAFDVVTPEDDNLLLKQTGVPGNATSAWLIELEDRRVPGTVVPGLALQVGRTLENQTYTRWVPYDDALRFSRREDAEAAAYVLLHHDRTIAVEHCWSN